MRSPNFLSGGILTNSVYIIADLEAYAYLKQAQVKLLASAEKGIMAYNCTLQRLGKSTTVDRCFGRTPGRHARQEMRVGSENMLKQNQFKSFRRACRNEALLSDLLFCIPNGSKSGENESGEQ